MSAILLFAVEVRALRSDEAGGVAQGGDGRPELGDMEHNLAAVYVAFQVAELATSGGSCTRSGQGLQHSL